MNNILDFLDNANHSITLVKMIAPACMAILFLQSGLDKVFNYADNLSYLKDHFKNTPLSIFVSFLMPTLTIFEVLAGILSAIGVFSLFTGNTKWAFFGLLLSAISLLSLFLGQRIAKDYGGAASLVSYIVLTIIGLLMLV